MVQISSSAADLMVVVLLLLSFQFLPDLEYFQRSKASTFDSSEPCDLGSRLCSENATPPELWDLE
jgi:hypothetical protein